MKISPYVAISALCVAAPVPANAADWWWTGGAIGAKRAVIFVDKASVQSVAGYARAWLKLVPEIPSEYFEIVSLAEVDCSQKRYRLLAQITRLSGGKTSNRNEQPVWAFVAPESAFDGTISAICGNKQSWITPIKDTSLGAKFIFEHLDN